jgi:hypothetical protein
MKRMEIELPCWKALSHLCCGRRRAVVRMTSGGLVLRTLTCNTWGGEPKASTHGAIVEVFGLEPTLRDPPGDAEASGGPAPVNRRLAVDAPVG